MIMGGRSCIHSTACAHRLFSYVLFMLIFCFLFPSSLGMEFAKTVVQPIKHVVPRSTIRGFKDDYYHVDADVVVLAGETHLGRKPVSGLLNFHMIDINWLFHSEGGHALHGGFFAL